MAAYYAKKGITTFVPTSMTMPYDALDTAFRTTRELKEYGLDAIECLYPRFTPEMTALYFALAKKYDLHTTGGSDFHGERVKPDIQLSSWKMDVDWLL